MVLNLDPSFRPYGVTVPDIPFEHFTFSGGEPHVKIHPETDINQRVYLTHRLNNFNDLGLLMVAVDALRRMGARQLELFIPYFPGARQDRLMTPGEPLTVKVYADLINAMGFERVTVFDPHSEVTPALLTHYRVMDNHTFIAKVMAQTGSAVSLVAPDGGALKKIYGLSKSLGGIPVLECSKHRDVKTGQLSGFKVQSDDMQGRDCLIVDDICDGGGTFLGLAEALKAKGAGRLYLAISHGIFSKGVEPLTTVFDHIFTTDSIRNWENTPQMTQFSLEITL
jgi:ribose-phosphate pyrophosphokinase